MPDKIIVVEGVDGDTERHSYLPIATVGHPDLGADPGRPVAAIFTDAKAITVWAQPDGRAVVCWTDGLRAPSPTTVCQPDRIAP